MTEKNISRNLNILIWAMIALMAAADDVMIWVWGMRVQIEAPEAYLFIMGVCAAASLIGHYALKDASVTAFGIAVNQMIISGVALGFYCYLTSRFNLPLIDAELIAADRLIGFDWRALLGWMNERPELGALLSACYRSFGAQIVIIVCLLFAGKHILHARRFMASFLLAGILCTTLAAFLPAVGAYAFYNLSSADYPNLNPAVGRSHEPILLGLRDGAITTLLFPVQGIVTFPSFHAAVGVLLIYACLPLRWLRLVFIVLNLGMIAATPIDGGHYLVDVVAGVALALLCIAAVQAFTSREHKLSPLRR